MRWCDIFSCMATFAFTVRKLTNYLAYVQLQYVERNSTKSEGANPRAQKNSRPQRRGQKRGKGAMPEKDQRTSLRIEASFPLTKKRIKNASSRDAKGQIGL